MPTLLHPFASAGGYRPDSRHAGGALAAAIG